MLGAKRGEPKTPQEWCERNGKPYTPDMAECWELARNATPYERLLMLYWIKGALAAKRCRSEP